MQALLPRANALFKIWKHFRLRIISRTDVLNNNTDANANL